MEEIWSLGIPKFTGKGSLEVLDLEAWKIFGIGRL